MEEFNAKRYSKAWDPISADRARIRVMLDYIGQGKKVLDIGCFDGSISACIKDAGNEVVGTDISLNALRLAKGKGISSVNADIGLNLPFADASFDVVSAGEIVEHISDGESFLKEIRRVLKPEGFAVLSTPNLASLGRRLLLLFGKNPFIENYLLEGSAGHVKYFVKDTLAEFLKLNGFRIQGFSSDAVSLDAQGRVSSVLLARIVPGLGKSLIVKAVKA